MPNYKKKIPGEPPPDEGGGWGIGRIWNEGNPLFNRLV
jgi:hypothetical protein